MPFVVVEVGYEYNDEIYYQPESGGGKPVHIYTSKKKAEQAALKLTAAALHKLDPITYGHGWDEVSSLDPEELKRKLEEIFPNQEVTTGKEGWMELGFKCGVTEHHRLYRAIGRPCPCEKDKSRYSPWPGDTTDEQLQRVAELLDRMPLHTVQEVDID